MNFIFTGIRYFDIDSCWQDDSEPKGAWACHGSAYAGSIHKIFKQIDLWMNEERNRNEVIVIHFNRDTDESKADQIGADILKLLKQFWVTKSNNEETPLTIQTSTIATLASSIAKNRRIYVIGFTPLFRDSLIIPHDRVGYTWVDMTFINSKTCGNLINKMDDKRCYRESFHRFTRYDLYLKYGLCRDHMAFFCRQYMEYGVKNCFEDTQRNRRTVNFIVVDYATEKVVRVAAEQNRRNIKFFLQRDV